MGASIHSALSKNANSSRNGVVPFSGNSALANSTAASSTAAPKIVLAGKLGLPEGFGPAQYEQKNERKRERQRRRQQLRQERIGTIREENDDGDEGEDGAGFIEGGIDEAEDDDGRGSSDNAEDDDDGQTMQTDYTGVSTVRSRHESAEQKRLRKAIAKEEKRQKRDAKREIKSLYKNEASKIGKCIGKEQSLERISVFKYT